MNYASERQIYEALEQQTATSEVLKVISSSPAIFSLCLLQCWRTPPVFARPNSEMFTSGMVMHFTFLRRTTARLPSSSIGGGRLYGPHPNAPMGRMVATKRLVHVIDASAEGAYVEQREPGITAAVELGGVRTALYVPMLKESELIGVFTIFRQEVRPFTAKQIEIVQNFAAQAVIATENARLLNELRQRTRELTEFWSSKRAISEILEVISNSPTDSQPAFDAIVRSGLRLFPNGVVVISLPDGDHVKLAAIAGADADDREKLRARYPWGLSREYITSTAIMDARELDFADAREAPVKMVRGRVIF